MIELEINRRHLHQWDYDQRVKIDYPAGTKVHFTASWYTEDKIPVVEAYEDGDGVYANIPNIFLTMPGTITAYIFLTDGESGHTEEKREFIVEAKPKPSDYAYTETEVLTWESLDRRITILERGGGGGGGEGGFSPIVEVKEIEGGHRVTIIDADGEHTFDVMDGKDGEDGKPGEQGPPGEQGIQGEPGKDGADGQPGKDGAPGQDGKDGAPGADGYTPVRGTDYWTPDDIAEIKSYVDEAILGGAW